MSGRVLVAGGVAVERIVEYHFLPRPAALRIAHTLGASVAGTGALAAVAAAAAGATVRCVATVGSDAAGRAIRDRLARADVDVTTVRPTPGESARLLRSLPAGAGGEESILLPGADAGEGVFADVAALDGFQPGDVLLLDWSSLPRAMVLIDAAYARDLQIVALLTPYPPTLTDADLGRVDVVILDQAGAAAMADGGYLPASLCVIVGDAGLSWDGQTIVAPGGSVPSGPLPTGFTPRGFAVPGPAPEVGWPAQGYAVLAGTIAARLALGDDRPEAGLAGLEAAATVGKRPIPYPDLRLHEGDLG
ncbi:MAG: hypothetical protein IPK37_12890 [Austwickia sp.]|nr:MAG: hypothetical protein IPK37_12890 [Austwickia sp.]